MVDLRSPPSRNVDPEWGEFREVGHAVFCFSLCVRVVPRVSRSQMKKTKAMRICLEQEDVVRRVPESFL